MTVWLLQNGRTGKQTSFTWNVDAPHGVVDPLPPISVSTLGHQMGGVAISWLLVKRAKNPILRHSRNSVWNELSDCSYLIRCPHRGFSRLSTCFPFRGRSNCSQGKVTSFQLVKCKNLILIFKQDVVARNLYARKEGVSRSRLLRNLITAVIVQMAVMYLTAVSLSFLVFRNDVFFEIDWFMDQHKVKALSWYYSFCSV